MDTDGTVLRVIKKVSLWTLSDGPVCLCINNGFVSVLDLATGNVVRIPSELNREWEYNLNVGCAIPSRKYKVVRFVSEHKPCKVVTLEDGAKWRQVRSPPTPSLDPDGYYQRSPVTVNGVMHFLYIAVTPLVHEDYVLRFDLESEEWKACIKGPRCGEKLQEDKLMADFNDTLCMMQWTSSDNICLIWVLADSAKGTWVKVYTIPMPPTFDSVRPLTVMRDGRKLLFHAPNYVEAISTLQIHDPLTGTCTKLEKFASNILGNGGICVLHLECFVSCKNLPIPAPSVLSWLISWQWLHRLNPVSLFNK
jgi:F-box interacting protein